jgi:hypothetical protein
VAEAGRSATADLRREAEVLGRLQDINTQLWPVRRRALLERLKTHKQELEDRLEKRDYVSIPEASKRVADQLSGEANLMVLVPTVQKVLLEVRGKALRARLDLAREESRALLRKDRFTAVAELGERTAEELAAEARVVGAIGEVEAFRTSCRVFGDLARRAKKTDPE